MFVCRVRKGDYGGVDRGMQGLERGLNTTPTPQGLPQVHICHSCIDAHVPEKLWGKEASRPGWEPDGAPRNSREGRWAAVGQGAKTLVLAV